MPAPPATVLFKVPGGRRRTFTAPLARPLVAAQKKCRWIGSRVLMVRI
jgi:hypothetical protein